MSAPVPIDYQQVFNASSHSMLLTEFDSGRIVDVNQAWIDSLGISRERARGHTGLELGVWVHVDERAACLAEIASKGQVREFHASLRTRAGERVHLISCQRLRMGDAECVLWDMQDISARLDAERALAEFTRDFSAFLDQTTDFVYFKDAQSRMRFCSQTLANITHHRHWRDLRGKHDREIFPPDTARIYEDEEGPVFATGVPLLGKENPYYDTDGNVRTVQTNKWPLFDAQGQVSGIFGISRDITDSLRLREAQAESETRLKLALKAGGMAVWDYRIPDDELYWSDELFTLLGIEPFAVTVDDFFGLIHPDDREDVQSRFDQAMASREPFYAELRMPQPDGSVRWIADFGHFEYAADGTPLRVIGLVQDITEQQRLREALREQHDRLEDLVAQRTQEIRVHQAKLQNILDGIPGVVGYWDHELRNRFANEGYRDWVGKGADEVLGKTMDEVLPAAHMSIVRPRIEAVMAGEPQRIELLFHPPTGRQPRYAEIHYVPDRQGDRVVGFFVLAFDITELRQAKEAADAASVAKSAFLANMSHEIRTPLNAILGMAHVMRRGALPPEQQARLDKLMEAGDHLLSIINAILEITKIDAGKLELEYLPVEPDRLLQRVAAMLEARALSKGLALVVEPSGVQTPLLGDPTRLQQALLNLADNAVKFTEHGQVTLRARVMWHGPGTAVLRFEVHDTGPGISAEAQQRLFGIFEQADNSTSRRFGGTGLGLAITRRLAQLMGGDAGADSESGTGSCFWFSARLHLPGSQDLSPPPPATAGDAEERLAQQHKGKRLLLCDDDAIGRLIGVELLTAAGLRVDTAADGEQAVQMALEQPPDLILMDMQMPKVDGLEATRRLRATAAGARVPIVALTANAFDDDRERCRAAGMNDFITKPLSPEHLYQVVGEWLSRAPLASP